MRVYQLVTQQLMCTDATFAALQCFVSLLGVSFLEGKEDIMEEWRKKFLNTYKVSFQILLSCANRLWLYVAYCV